MDDLLATLSQATGAQVPQSAAPAGPGSFDPAKSYGTPPQMLDNLKGEESSGNAYAVNPKTGAMGPYQFTPSTLAMLRKQGVAFDPFDPVQSRNAADWYLQRLKQQNGGTYEGALKAYGGFVHADPTQYVNKAMAGVAQQSAGPTPTTPGQSNSGQQASGYAGPTSDLLDTLQSAVNAPAQPARSSGPQQQQAPSAMAQFGRSAAGLADTILSGPGQLAQQADYAARRAFQQSPEQAQAASQHDFGGALHPIGNAFGVTNTPEYQNEASQRAQQAIGEKIGQGVSAVANATGAAPQDVANMAGSLSLAVPGAVKAAIPVVRGAASAVGRGVDAAADTAARAFPQPEATPPAPTWQQAKATYAAAPEPAMQERGFGAASVGSAAATSNPYPLLTGEESARGPFPQVKASKIAQDVSQREQDVRAGIVNQIMGENAGPVRTGVITGNENTLRDEYAAANSPIQTPASIGMKQQFAREQNALANYAQERIDATGANQSILSDEERGRVINDALYGQEDSLTSYLRGAKQQIYDQARATAGDNPIQTAHVDTLLADPQFRAGVKLGNNETTLAGAQDLIDLARTTGFKDPVTGEMYQPNSVAAWDAVRKSLNSQWSPSNANLIRQLNGAIDRDIAATGGQEMYKLGDRIHQVEKTLLDSKGIGSVLGEYDANGIKTGPSLESIPSKLNNMPLDQWQHIHDTLDDLSRGRIRGAPEGMPAVPQDLMRAAAQARNEMDGALARAVYEAGASKAGVWNQNSVNKVLNSSVGEKITRNFSPDEVQAFHTLNYGGQIMPGVHSYEGAGNQLARLNKPGFVERFAPAAGESVGGVIGSAIPIPGAGFVGRAVGERAGTKLSSLAGGRRAAQQLKDLNEELMRNGQRGVPLNRLTQSNGGKP